MLAGTSYTHHLQLFSKKTLWNEEATKEPKSSQIKILEPTTSQKSQIFVFWLEPIWQPCSEHIMWPLQPIVFIDSLKGKENRSNSAFALWGKIDTAIAQYIAKNL